jgi:hypothetical protein
MQAQRDSRLIVPLEELWGKTASEAQAMIDERRRQLALEALEYPADPSQRPEITREGHCSDSMPKD